MAERRSPGASLIGMFARILALSIVSSAGLNVARAQDALSNAVMASSAEAGKRYALRCKACHTLEKGGANRLGPNLWGIVGRKPAEVQGFNYSPALRKLGGTWTLQALNSFLLNPRKHVPGNRMAFAGIKREKQRLEMLHYLATLNDTPPKALAPPKAASTSASKAPSDTPSLADELGLAKGAGRETVAAICAACHSLAIVRQQGLDRDRWDELMTWMTEKQGMPPLEGDNRKEVVEYLAKNFGPQSRAPSGNPMMPRMPGMPLPAMPVPQPK